jgi:hypothetical protein
MSFPYFDFSEIEVRESLGAHTKQAGENTLGKQMLWGQRVASSASSAKQVKKLLTNIISSR